MFKLILSLMFTDVSPLSTIPYSQILITTNINLRPSTMKFTPLFTKIAASLIVFAKAVNGQCPDVPATVAAVGLGGTYCYLVGINQGFANLFEIVVSKSVEIDPTYAFLSECLEDVLAGSLSTQTGACREINCEDGKTEFAIFSEVKNVTTATTLGWDTPLCLKASCDTDVLQQVLTETYLDFFDFVSVDWRNRNFTATATYTPTAECLYDQIVDPVENPELYCSGDNAPVCSNIKLVEITIGEDAPFEVAICDDNDCIASVGTADIAGHYATGYMSANPFCIEDEGRNFQNKFQTEPVTSKYSDKAFESKSYCSAKAASRRTGRCNTTSKATKKGKKGKKATKAPKVVVPKSPKQGKKSKKSV